MPNCLCPLKQAAQDSPNKIAFVCANTELTFYDLDRQADKMGSQLQSIGIQAGSLIAVLHPTNSHLISLFFAAWRLGASICPLNLRLPPAQIQSYLSELSPQLFISSFPLPSQKSTPSITPIFQSLLLFTSGSTGNPKIAVLSLPQLIANAIYAISKLNLQSEDRWLLYLPLYHVGGIGIMIRSVLARATILLNERDPNITHLSWVPTQLYRATPIYKKLKCLLLGGAAVNAIPNNLPCFISYGLTEMGSIVTLNDNRSNLSCGDPLQGREISLAADGEISVRGTCLFEGYWKDKNLEKPFCKEGWFKTGDIGHYCPIKGLTILGRKDWQFISGGENIQPEEIEQALLQINCIIEATVIPIADPEFGARPIAFVKSSNSQFNHQLMRGALLEKLPKYKIPISLILVDEMPKKGLKTDRNQLLAQFLTGSRTKDNKLF
jgi:O-succinylbenzoic acid--CoA ligase